MYVWLGRAGKDNLWSVEPVLKKLRKKRLEESTVERVYEVHWRSKVQHPTATLLTHAWVRASHAKQCQATCAFDALHRMTV
jgi:hypothetical protein